MGPDLSLVVIDNGSTDDSCDFVAQHYPQVRLVCLDRNYGFTGGYNKGLEQVNADYFVLLNSDVEVTPGWLEPMQRLMDDDATVGICMPKIRAYDHRDAFEYAGAAGGFIDRFGFPFCRGRILTRIEEDKGQYDERREVFWATGACMMVRSALYRSLGGFDDTFFAHMEEIDFCWRAQLSGFRVLCEPAAMVYHVGGGTLPNDNPHKLYLNYRNSLYMLYKNLPHRKRPFIFGVRLVLDGLSALVYLMNGKFSFFNAVWKAHMHFWKTRRQLKVTTSVAPASVAGLYGRSIVWDFFLTKGGKLRFSDIDKHASLINRA